MKLPVEHLRISYLSKHFTPDKTTRAFLFQIKNLRTYLTQKLFHGSIQYNSHNFRHFTNSNPLEWLNKFTFLHRHLDCLPHLSHAALPIVIIPPSSSKILRGDCIGDIYIYTLLRFTCKLFCVVEPRGNNNKFVVNNFPVSIWQFIYEMARLCCIGDEISSVYVERVDLIFAGIKSGSSSPVVFPA